MGGQSESSSNRAIRSSRAFQHSLKRHATNTAIRIFSSAAWRCPWNKSVANIQNTLTKLPFFLYASYKRKAQWGEKMIEMSSKIFKVLPHRLRSIYNGLSIPHRIFIKEHILICPNTYKGCRSLAHRALNREEFMFKYKDAIKEAEDLAVAQGLDPMWLCSSVCPRCQIPSYRSHGALVCLKCGRID